MPSEGLDISGAKSESLGFDSSSPRPQESSLAQPAAVVRGVW
jgi:hypothetical protein